MTYPRLEAPRLLLRPFAADDAAAVERYAGEWAVADTTLTIPHPYPPGAAATWIAGHAASWDARQVLTLAICGRDAPTELLGAVGLNFSLEHAHGEIGYWIGVPFWGCGYATEAAHAVLTYAFDVLELHRVQARHFIRNPASGRVMQKLGMTLEGVHRDAYRRWDKFETVAVYAILAPNSAARAE